jgi:antitoxin component of RelBE/YafQ-DinJ toxin-antitoxin module
MLNKSQKMQATQMLSAMGLSVCDAVRTNIDV